MERPTYLGIVDEKNPPASYDKYYWLADSYVEGMHWCKLHHRPMDYYKGYIKDTHDILPLFEEAGRIKENLLDTLFPILNDYNRCDYDRYEWNIILGMWLETYVICVHDKYMRLSAVNEMGEKFVFRGCNPGEWHIPLDYREHQSLSEQDISFHRYQYSLVHQWGNFENITRKNVPYEPSIPSEIDYKRVGFQQAYRAYLAAKYRKVGKEQNSVVLQNSYLPKDFIRLAVDKGRGRIINYRYNYVQSDRLGLAAIKPDLTWRRIEIPVPKGAAKSEQCIYALLKHYLPIAYVEGFSYIHHSADRDYRHSKNARAVIYSPTAYTYDEPLKHFLIRSHRNGASLREIQHGGNYGGIADWRTFRTCRQIDDVFYTWGWSLKENTETEWSPMPAAKLLHPTINHVQEGNDILYINYNLPKYVYDVDDIFIFSMRNKKAEEKFLAGLSDDLKRRMLIRLYPYDFGWNERERIEAISPLFRFDGESEYYRSLNQAKMIVLSDWSTTILEALFTGKPILVYFYDRNTWPEFEWDLNEMKRVGIVYDNWEDLSATLENIVDDIDGWWSEPERVKVVDYIKNKYTYMPKNAKRIWVDELLRLAEDTPQKEGTRS